MNRTKGVNKRGLALSQILVLIVGIIAIGFLIGGEIKTVSALPQNKAGIASGSSKFVKGLTPDKETIDKVKLFHIPKGEKIAVVVAGAIGLGLTAVLKGEDRETAKGITSSLMTGYTAKVGVTALLRAFGATGAAGPIGFAVGGVIALAIILSLKKTKHEVVSFECSPWQPPKGGDDCDQCNTRGILPCSAYQCRALGASCELVNPGTEAQRCTSTKKNDVKAPVINPFEEILTEGLDYRPDNAISLPDRGVRIVSKETDSGCIKAFQPFTFGIQTDEFAQCKIDSTRRIDYDSMDEFFGGSTYYLKNHSQGVVLLGLDALDAANITLENGGNFEYYIKCMDNSPNKNYNAGNFVVKYCVDEGPDNDAPIIRATSVLNDNPIATGQDTLELDVYVDEPADCRWTHDTDKSFENMEGRMDCASGILEFNLQMLYKCTTTLEGLKDNQENKFFFRCKDKPLQSEDRIEMPVGYEYTLIGTQPLVIDSVGPNGTIKDSTDLVKITLEAETSAGFDDGDSICSYGETEAAEIDKFFETDSYTHKQDLWLPEGDYKFYIKCTDLGGNIDTEEVIFSIEVDKDEPNVVRAFKDSFDLRIITNEKASCVYSTSTSSECNYPFDEALKMIVTNDVNHFVSWNPSLNFYIKCRDEYGNEPNPDECNIVVKPFDL